MVKPHRPAAAAVAAVVVVAVVVATAAVVVAVAEAVVVEAAAVATAAAAVVVAVVAAVVAAAAVVDISLTIRSQVSLALTPGVPIVTRAVREEIYVEANEAIPSSALLHGGIIRSLDRWHGLGAGSCQAR